MNIIIKLVVLSCFLVANNTFALEKKSVDSDARQKLEQLYEVDFSEFPIEVNVKQFHSVQGGVDIYTIVSRECYLGSVNSNECLNIEDHFTTDEEIFYHITAVKNKHVVFKGSYKMVGMRDKQHGLHYHYDDNGKLQAVVKHKVHPDSFEGVPDDFYQVGLYDKTEKLSAIKSYSICSECDFGAEGTWYYFAGGKLVKKVDMGHKAIPENDIGLEFIGKYWNMANEH